ncbi:MAG: hypothetical protein Q8O56_13715 [Solirubrobacteraceae bacterium]|nr:hypothetical protein [Solirubrobacteraceae bacterium]
MRTATRDRRRSRDIGAGVGVTPLGGVGVTPLGGRPMATLAGVRPTALPRLDTIVLGWRLEAPPCVRRTPLGDVGPAASLVGAVVDVPEMFYIGPPGVGLSVCHMGSCPLSGEAYGVS